MRDSLDRRLKTAREMEEHFGVPRLGQLSEEALGHTGLGANGGRRLSDVDLDAVRIMRTNLEFLDVDRPLRSVAVTSALPEEGKSTVAMALAWAYAFAGKRTLLVECDLRRSVLAERLALEVSPGLSDYLAGRASPQDILQAIDLDTYPDEAGNGESPVEDGHGHQLVCIMAGPPPPRPAEMLGSERFRAFLEQITEAYDMVVLDTSPLLSVVDTRELLPFVDGLVVCARSFQTTRDEARAAREALDRFPARPTGLVVTGVKPGTEAGYGYYYGYAAEPAER